MAKPDWLIEQERKKSQPKREFPKCCDCVYYGRPVKKTRHKGKELIPVFECDLHPGCFNTMYSVRCDDWTPTEL